ncbi:MAG: 23S rRNA (pseudouridine(1915)-N(3))-methyltransferase RlmH [Burkholderiales bacterium]|nr:23S rRNA (pseudouridine(1915)-N(3))-methyltransferase RlmH [Burkholderiales bacterium]
MKIQVIAIGNRLPNWAEEACNDYLRRFPKDWNVEVKALKAEDRTGRPIAKIMQAEAERIKNALPKEALPIALDEHGKDLTTKELANQFRRWYDSSQSIAFIIGGADGLASEIKEMGPFNLRLSSLTLPHALARVLLLEQIYRSWSLIHNHPYHRA